MYISTWGIGFYGFVRSLTADVASLGKQALQEALGLLAHVDGTYTEIIHYDSDWLWLCYITKSIV